MNRKHNIGGITRLLQIQLGITALLAVICAVIFDAIAGTSVLLGGLTCIIPNACFARKLFKYQGARAAKQIVNGFYKGEALKIFLSILLFTVVFVFCRISPFAFFGSYILILITHWFAPLVIINKQNRPESD